MTGSAGEFSQFLPGYLAEVDEHLGAATRHLLAIDAHMRRGEPSPRAVREVFRSVHTIKGLSAMMGIAPIVDLAHAMETMLRAADAAGGAIDARSADVLTRGLHQLELRVRAVAAGTEAPAAPVDLIRELDARPAPAPLTPMAASAASVSPELRGELEKLTPSEREQLTAASREGRRAVRLEYVPSATLAAAGVTITAVRDHLASVGEIVKVVPISRVGSQGSPGGLSFALWVVTAVSDAELTGALGGGWAASVDELTARPAPQPAAPAVAEEPADEAPTRRGIVRVELERLDDALDKLSALVVTRFRLERAAAALAARGTDVRDLAAILAENARQLRHLRASIMRARMVSAAELLERLPLLVRRLSTEMGKPIDLELDTGRAELDKGVGERIFPVLVHLVRNALDHALEAPAERKRAGKPERGKLRVTCFERNDNQLEIVVEDDGRGVDAEALARRAGMPVPTTEEGLVALMARPGLSSRDEVTLTSGRGVGMDIVKRTIVDELGGQVALRTRLGFGTAFTLRVPLTITIVDAFAFACGAQTFVVPVSGVEEIVELDPARVVSVPAGPGRNDVKLLERRGDAMPLVHLRDVLKLDASPAGVRKAIIIRRTGQPFAFEIDRMLGQQEIVVRPLADPLVRSPGVVGSTDLGDGQPTLVLDLASLGARLSRRKSDPRAKDASA